MTTQPLTDEQLVEALAVAIIGCAYHDETERLRQIEHARAFDTLSWRTATAEARACLPIITNAVKAEREQSPTAPDGLREALVEVEKIALSHTNYGHVEGNRRAFAIVRDLRQRIEAIKDACLSQSPATTPTDCGSRDKWCNNLGPCTRHPDEMRSCLDQFDTALGEQHGRG